MNHAAQQQQRSQPIGLTTCASAELASQGIRVNLICPGIIDTPMHHRARKLVGDEMFDAGILPSVHVGGG